MKPIYLDHNATTPLDRRVFSAMEPFLKEHYGNPSSTHYYGRICREAVEQARTQVSGLLNCQAHEIIFTSGGTESNNFAIKGMANALSGRGRHIITSCIEHPAVLEVCRYLETKGYDITYLPVDGDGLVSAADLEAGLRPDTILVSIMHANNETGSIQPLAEIAGITRKHGIPFHTDAAQSAGKIPVDVNKLGVDLLSLAGHKLYGPKGTGVLYIRDGTKPEKLIHGADHESGWRAGTENVAQVVGLGMACELAGRNLEGNAARLRQTRDLLFEKLSAAFPDICRNANPDKCLPNTLNVSFPGLDAGLLVASLEEVALSSGAACHSGDSDTSHVLRALHLGEEYLLGALRFSTGVNTTTGEIEKAAGIIEERIREICRGTGTGASKTEIRLTRYTRGLGCACKLPALELETILSKLPEVENPDVLVDARYRDDAAVYRISKDTALIQTLDFFTPLIDDPHDFGAVAAANALSDIYAMGGEPVFALNIVGFPVRRLPLEVLHRILEGAGQIARQAGISILGGHSIENQEPVFGMAVSGIASPNAILTNAGAKPGDVLILTKPLGTGIITTAIKMEQADTSVASHAIEIMKQLNKKAAELMKDYRVHACTDITGFGLTGHLLEMLRAAGVSASIISESVPVLPGTRELVRSKMIPGGTTRNMEYTASHTSWEPSVPEPVRVILNDAQTSGGLLISLPEEPALKLLRELQKNGFPFSAIIGSITGDSSPNIKVS